MCTCMHMEAECNKTTRVVELCRCHTQSVNAVNVTQRYIRIAFEKLANVKIESTRGISNMCGVEKIMGNNRRVMKCGVVWIKKC